MENFSETNVSYVQTVKLQMKQNLIYKNENIKRYKSKFKKDKDFSDPHLTPKKRNLKFL